MITVGTVVLVTKLKKHGVITEVLTDSNFKVAIGALTIRVSSEDIVESAPKESKTKEPERNQYRVGNSASALSQGAKLRSIDLHGVTVEEGIILVEQHISSAIMAGLDEIEIIHGIGTGKLSAAIHKHLATLPVVKKFEIRPYNRGTTRVFL